MKRLLTMTALGLVLGATSVAAQDDPIKLGFFGPLTGPSAQAGQALRNGARIAIDEINEGGGLLDRQVSLTEYDDRSSPEQAVRSATKLIQVDDVDAIVGSLHSGNILAAGPEIESGEVPLVGAGTSPTWLQQGYTYLFRALGNSELSAVDLANYAAEQGYAEVAIIHSNDEYGNSGAAVFEEAIGERGIEISDNESFTHGDRDFTGQIGSIARSSPDAVFVWALGDDLGPLTKQMRQLGYFGPILGPEGYTLPEALEIAGSTADGVIFAAQYLIPESADAASDPMIGDFLTAYQEEFGEMPASDNAFRGYDAVKVLAEGMRRAETTEGPAVRDAIQTIDDLEGIAGTFDYTDGSGEGISSVRLYRIEDGAYSEVE